MQQLSNTEALLNIVESNNFKQLIHISLRVRSANDESLKKFLSSKVAEYKMKSEELTKKLSEKEEYLRQTNLNFDIIEKNLNVVNDDHNKEIDKLHLQ